MVNRRTRTNRRRRSRRSRNQSWQQRQQRRLSAHHNDGGGRPIDRAAPRYVPPTLRTTQQAAPTPRLPFYRDDWGAPPQYQPAPSPPRAPGGHLHQATSVVSNALNRITEFLRRDQKPDDGGISAVVFDESSSEGGTMLPKDPSAILIQTPAAPKIVFQCQLAHGSPTALISEFNNPTELYQKIADSYDDVEPDQILFCTRNTHRVQMDAVLSGTLTTTDFIFAHLRGQKKEVELTKNGKLLGVTLSDNWAGRVFIRKIDVASQLAESRPAVDVGDHIEAINGESVVGKRHYQVANMLRKLAVGSTLTLRLISPLKSGFSFIAPRSGAKKMTAALPVSVGATDGAQTIRFKSDGSRAVIEEPLNKVILDRLNDVFDRYLGFNDDELANTVLDIGRECTNLKQMEERCLASSLKDFEFTPEFLFDLWGAVDDWKRDRLNPNATKKSATSVVEKEPAADSASKQLPTAAESEFIFDTLSDDESKLISENAGDDGGDVSDNEDGDEDDDDNNTSFRTTADEENSDGGEEEAEVSAVYTTADAADGEAEDEAAMGAALPPPPPTLFGLPAAALACQKAWKSRLPTMDVD